MFHSSMKRYESCDENPVATLKKTSTFCDEAIK